MSYREPAWAGRPSPRPGDDDHALRTSDGLVTFLYLLMRDHVPAGAVEAVVCHVEDARERAGEGEEHVAFSNDFLAAYALELAERLRGKIPEHALFRAHEAIREAQGRE